MSRRAIIVLFLAVVALTGATLARQQSKSPNKSPKYSRTNPVVKLSAPDLATVEAASKNAELRTDLQWGFGGRGQRGWYIYTPLISQLIGATEEPSPRDFARLLARWQGDRRLGPTGVLDSETWMEMVSHWQSRRIKNRGYPSPDQLVTIPVEDCFDPERPVELRKLERGAYDAYKRMTRAAARELNLAVTEDGSIVPAEKYLKIISAFRTREYQDQLRQKSPGSSRAGLAVNSPHFTGRALDIYVGGEPVNTRDDNRAIQTRTPAYRWLVRNAARFGFQPYFYEPWHWEYVGD
jgi:hypothetical protein